jgi:hypothetical protein
VDAALVTGPCTAPTARPRKCACPAVLRDPDRQPASTTTVAWVAAAINRFLARNLLRTKNASSSIGCGGRGRVFSDPIWAKRGQTSSLAHRVPRLSRDSGSKSVRRRWDLKSISGIICAGIRSISVNYQPTSVREITWRLVPNSSIVGKMWATFLGPENHFCAPQGNYLAKRENRTRDSLTPSPETAKLCLRQLSGTTTTDWPEVPRNRHHYSPLKSASVVLNLLGKCV